MSAGRKVYWMAFEDREFVLCEQCYRSLPANSPRFALGSDSDKCCVCMVQVVNPREAAYPSGGTAFCMCGSCRGADARHEGIELPDWPGWAEFLEERGLERGGAERWE